MLKENPYQPPLLTATNNARLRIMAAIWWMIYLHPAIALVLVHACWATTTVSLGRPPNFGEHPENALAHSLVHILDIPAMLLILATPILVPPALCWGLAQPFATAHEGAPPMRKRIACLTMYLLMVTITAGLCYYDPFRAVYWFMD